MNIEALQEDHDDMFSMLRELLEEFPKWSTSPAEYDYGRTLIERAERLVRRVEANA